MIGAKLCTETADLSRKGQVVGERSVSRRSGTVRSRGGIRSENVGMSNDKTGENPVRRKPKVSWTKVVLPGLGGY
jgi:hypothetical protein